MWSVTVNRCGMRDKSDDNSISRHDYRLNDTAGVHMPSIIFELMYLHRQIKLRFVLRHLSLHFVDLFVLLF